MALSISDMLFHDFCAERSDAIIFKLAKGGVIHIPRSTNVVAHLVLEGTIKISTSEMDKPIALSKGEYGLVFYGSEHSISIDDNSHFTFDHWVSDWPTGEEPPTVNVGTTKTPAARFISASLQMIHNIAKTRSVQPLPPLVALKHEGQMSFLNNISLLTDTEQIEAVCRGPGADAFINALMNLHLTHALRCAHAQIKNSFPVQISASKVRVVAAAVRMMRTHPEHHWTIAKLARDLGLSRSSFADKFYKHVGIGPIEYLHNVRMEKAVVVLLHERNQPLLSIAKQVGYEAASSFSRAFKIRYGLSPRTFVDQYKTNPPLQTTTMYQ